MAGRGEPSDEMAAIRKRASELEALLQREHNSYDQELKSLIERYDRRLRLIYEQAPAMLHAVDMDGILVRVSNEWLRVLGYRRDEVIGRSPTDFMTPEAGQRAIDEAFPNLLQRGFITDVPYQFICKDGRTIDILLSAVVERDDDGNFLQAFAVLKDVTAEIEAKNALQDREALLRNLIEHSPSAIFLKNLEGKFRFANRVTQEWFGVPLADMVGKSSIDLFQTKEAEGFVAHDRETLRRGAAVEREYVHRFPNGSVHTLVAVKFPVMDHLGKANGIATIVTDVTEQKRTEEQLRQSQKMQALGNLTGGVAHDFNNLLAIIIGNLDLLDTGQLHDDETKELLDPAMRAARRGADLTERLLAFGRRQPLSPSVVDLNRLIADSTPLLRRTLQEIIEIEIVSAGGLWHTMIDAAQMENALVNVAVNARDAMPNGGRLTIETANSYLDLDYTDQHEEVEQGQYVMLAVTDAGIGMDESVIQQAFEPFFTTKSPDQGSGLGLSMVYGFVKQSKGHVKIYSEPGRGTTIKIYLPRHLGDQPRQARPSVPEVAFRPNNEVILVVEDDIDVLDMSYRMLDQIGFEVLRAEAGDEALAILSAKPRIDLLLTDVVLPKEISGQELASHARAIHPDIKVLFMSGYTQNAIVHNSVLDPGVNLISKPFRKADLARKVQMVLSDDRS